MKTHILLCGILMCVLSRIFRGNAENETRLGIFNGLGVEDPNEAAFMVMVYGVHGGGCGGNLIDSKTVITAAHCVRSDELLIHYGTYDRKGLKYPVK